MIDFSMLQYTGSVDGIIEFLTENKNKIKSIMVNTIKEQPLTYNLFNPHEEIGKVKTWSVKIEIHLVVEE